MRVWKSVLILLSVALFSDDAAAEPTSRSVVGNWTGTFDGETIEMSVWFDSEPLQFGYARGYLLNHTRNCGIGFIGEHTMSNSTTFFGYISDNDLANHSIELELRNLPTAAFTLCAPLAPTHGRLMLDYDAESGQTALYARDASASSSTESVLEKLSTMTRQQPSAMMRSTIEANPGIDRERGAAALPGPGAARLMADPSLDPETTITHGELPCRVHLRDQQVRMREMGISKLAGSLESANEIGVRYERFADSDNKEQYTRIDFASVSQHDFLEMPARKDGLRFGPDACKQAAAAS